MFQIKKSHCMLQSYTRQKNWCNALEKLEVASVRYLLVRWDGHSEHFDGMLSCLIGSLLDPTTWLLVAGHRVAIRDHHYVLILMIMGAPADRCMWLFSHMAICKNHILKCHFKQYRISHTFGAAQRYPPWWHSRCMFLCQCIWFCLWPPSGRDALCSGQLVPSPARCRHCNAALQSSTSHCDHMVVVWQQQILSDWWDFISRDQISLLTSCLLAWRLTVY